VVALLPSLALAAGTAPEDRLEVQAEVGVSTGQAATLVGLGGGLREGPFTVIGAAGFGARGDWFDTGGSDRPGFGAATLQLGLDAATGPIRAGLAVLGDAVLVDAVEEGCDTERDGCRHGWFWGADGGAELGVGVQPAYGVRLSGPGTHGAGFVTFLGVQPNTRFGTLYWFTPRLDLAIYGRDADWSLHTWAGRYGLGVGLGRRLSRPAR
jgi:hypothetical protein